MFTRLGCLAATLKEVLGYRKAGLAASILALSLILSGCSSFMDPDGGSRFWQAVADIWQMLPESTPTTPLEIFEMVFGVEFAETFERWVMAIVQQPAIEDSIFGTILYWLSFIIFILMGAYLMRYLWQVSSEIERVGRDNVLEGNSNIIPPTVYLPLRYLPVAVVVVTGPALVQLCINFTWRIITDFADALYADAGQSIGTVMFELLAGMLEGAKVWLFLIMLVFVLGIGFWVLVVYAWRYISIFVYTVKMLLRAPKYLGGDAMSYSLTEPIMDVLKRVAILGITWFVVLVGPFLISEMNVKGVPAVIGLVIVEVLAIAAPWIILGFGGALASRTYSRVHTWVGTVDSYEYRPAPTKGPSVAKRVWQGTKDRASQVGTTAVNMARSDPEVGPIIAAGMAAHAMRSGPGSWSTGSDKGAWDEPSTSATSDPLLNRLASLVKDSPFKGMKHLDDAVYALCVEIASVSSDKNQQEVLEEATARATAMQAKTRARWAFMGRELKKMV